MARDFAKRGGQASGHRKPVRGAGARKVSPARSPAPTRPGGVWKWYGAGVLTGVFLSFLVYLGTLPPTGPIGETPAAEGRPASQNVPPKPRFDFYKMLPEQSIEVEPAAVATPRSDPSAERYLLQAGSFRQQQDADARRAELLLLGLEPRIEVASGDNGRWYRVYLGPFDSRAGVAKARSLTAAQGIDTLLLKRSEP